MIFSTNFLKFITLHFHIAIAPTQFSVTYVLYNDSKFTNTTVQNNDR